ncbi:uncharacterized protein LOC119663646 [Teleopsis dalmanni]|uniref:uncharacterized protein LOC119663646 n=2 Tax=Teleopsis dalmanni TaxID=139649 RepID=UPI0018CFBBA8|nr:uncharacterized protein LOC119663646 [Teleopsis dalmanni]
MTQYSPIKLFVKICDIRGACNIIYGDPLSIDYTTITDTEFNIQKEIVKSAFIRTDYETAHNLIFMAALTYKNADQKRYNEWRDYIKDIMHKEINKLVEHPTTQFYISHNEIIQFVSRAKNNLELLDLNDPSTLEKLLEVLDQITTVSANNDIASQTDAQGKNLEMLDRYRSYSGDRYTNNKVKTISVDLAYVEMNLQLIQDILKSRSSNGSTDNIKVTERVNALVEKMCYSELILNENIKTNFASISISKMTGNYLLKKEFSISAIHTKEEGSFKIRQANLISETTPYCVSIVQYTEDFFTNQNNYVINLAVFDLKILTSVLDWKANEAHQDPHTHSLQIKLAKSKSDENICLSRRNRNSAWVTDNCKVKAVSILHVFCSCFYLGYFRLSAIKNNHDNGISYRPSPTKNIISFPNDNHITPNIFLSSTSEATTPALFTMAAVPSQNISNIATTMYVTRQELRTTTPANHKIDADIEKGYIKTAKPNESVKKASPLIYAIPVALLLIIAIVFVFLMILYRRRPKKSNASTIPGLNIQLESRQRQAGIKYATIYDQHLVRGSF